MRDSAHQRSIPACTGEPIIRWTTICGSTVYPRVYGGTPLRLSYAPSSWVYPRVYGGTRGIGGPLKWTGLSPRVRGNLTLKHPPARELRSIPACTGEPGQVFFNSHRRILGLSPRVRGNPIEEAVIALTGLSPRVRGNQQRFSLIIRRTGSIPACTGEPLLSLLDFLPP